MKVGREEMVALWLACEKYATLDFDALDKVCESQAHTLQQELEKIPGLRTHKLPFDRLRRLHRIVATWDEQSVGLTAAEAEQRLLDGEPRVAVTRPADGGLMFTVFKNEPGDELTAAKRLREVIGA